MNSTLQFHKTRSTGFVTLACAVTLLGSLAACSKTDDGKTVGEKIDAAVTKTEQLATDATNTAKSSMDNAGSAIKSDTRKAEDSSQKMGETVSAKVHDMAITASVSSELAKDTDLSALKIDVDTRDGKVTLSGPAPNAAAKEKATALAKGVKGVSSVDNKLVVKS
jgi:hyperosmotically inducible protein